MQLTSEAYIWLAGSVVAAVILDLLVTRLLLEVFRPASAYAFWSGRGGKLTAIFLWIAFVVAYWWPQFVDPVPPDWLKMVGLALIFGLLVVAFVTHPRGPQHHGQGQRSTGDA
jgi:hypothetical protein